MKIDSLKISAGKSPSRSFGRSLKKGTISIVTISVLAKFGCYHDVLYVDDQQQDLEYKYFPMLFHVMIMISTMRSNNAFRPHVRRWLDWERKIEESRSSIFGSRSHFRMENLRKGKAISYLRKIGKIAIQNR